MSIAALLTEAAAAEEMERALEFARRWRLYLGEHEKPLTVRAGAPDDNVTPNFSGLFVDKGVSFLFGKDVDFTLEDSEQAALEGDTERSPEEAYLEQVWRANRKMSFLHKLALNGGVCGHAFVKIIERAPQLPRLIVLDPGNVTAVWDQEDIERVLGYKIQYNVIEEGQAAVRRQLIELDEQGESWTIRMQVGRETRIERGFIDRSLGTAPSLVTHWEDVGEPVLWAHAFPPIIDTQNLPRPNEYWGTSDLEGGVVDLNHALSRVASNMTRIVRLHGHPKTVTVGLSPEDASRISVNVDGVLNLPNPESSISNLEMSSDLSASIEVYKRLKEAMHEIGRVPEVATGKLDSIGQLSGLAMGILYQPLLEKTETKRRLYGDLLVELNRRLLALAGQGEDAVTTIHWPELLPGDPKAEAETAVIHHELGVSTTTLVNKFGYDAQTEAELSAAEAEASAETAARAFDRGAAA